MPTFMLEPVTGRYLSFEERELIGLWRAQCVGVREIARRLHRDPSTISRELRRNAATRGGKLEYRGSVAQWKAELTARRPKTAKMVTNQRLHDYVRERLSGQIRRPDGSPAAGPTTAPWKGRNKPRRQDRAGPRHGARSRSRTDSKCRPHPPRRQCGRLVTDMGEVDRDTGVDLQQRFRISGVHRSVVKRCRSTGVWGSLFSWADLSASLLFAAERQKRKCRRQTLRQVLDALRPEEGAPYDLALPRTYAEPCGGY
jgi:hypothetical protein